MTQPIDIIKSASVAREAIRSIVQSKLTDAINRDGKAVMALSGGNTPLLYLPDLFSLDVDWSRTNLILSDERWVPTSHKHSNEGMINHIRQTLPAKSATLISLWSATETAAGSAQNKSEEASNNGLRIDICLLGMGDDGHIASLFPWSDALKAKEPFWIAVPAPMEPNVPVDRISLSPSAITNADNVALIFAGRRKFEIWREIWNGPPDSDQFPVCMLKSHPNLTTMNIDYD